MKLVLVCLFSYIYLTSLGQEDFKLFYEAKKQGFIIYADNDAFCPMSMLLDLNLQNLKFSEGQQALFVIPPKTKRFKIGELDMVNPDVYKFSYKYHVNIGNIFLAYYDTAYQYDLPFEKGKSYLLYQGYNGQFSHQNENELDFTMPEGTKVMAAREGIVVKVVQENKQSCPTEECKKYNNFIVIYHPDGSFGMYAHIKYNGAAVKVGDTIQKGDLIAYSGNTGFSSGPHLHFACQLPSIENKKTIVTKFKIDKGSQAIYLKEKTFYLKDY